MVVYTKKGGRKGDLTVFEGWGRARVSRKLGEREKLGKGVVAIGSSLSRWGQLGKDQLWGKGKRSDQKHEERKEKTMENGMGRKSSVNGVECLDCSFVPINGMGD